MEQQIKELRIEIDGLTKLTDLLCPIKNQDDSGFFVYTNTYQIKESVKSLLLAKAWLGKVLQELGIPSPYKSGYKTVEDIEPTADTAKIVAGMTQPFPSPSGETTCPVDTWELNGEPMAEYDNLTYIGKVDYIRTEIQKIIDNTTDFSQTYPDIELEQSFVYKYLCEARFWLGFELQRIKEEENNN